MTGPIVGGCLCGAVRYDCKAEPMLTARCHCRQCQKASGGGGMTFLVVPKDALTITGAVSYFDSKADSGATASRGFCPSCGSRLFGHTTSLPETTAITAGSLDDPSWFKPGMNLFAATAQPWSHLDEQLPAFPAMPPMEAPPPS